MHFKYEDRNRLNIRVEKAYAILTLVKKKAAVSTSTSDKEGFQNQKYYQGWRT